jgi:hypothetical protein
MYKFSEYRKDCLRTESTLEPLTEETTKRGIDNRMMHCIIGFETEINEMYEIIEKSNDWDIVNFLEELGDLFWFGAIFNDAIEKKHDISVLVEEMFNQNYTRNARGANLEMLHKIRFTAGEMLDHMKKVLFYGKQADIKTICLHFEDLINYANVLICGLGGNVSSVMKININKLKARYPKKFNLEDAENRDLEKERKILEESED